MTFRVWIYYSWSSDVIHISLYKGGFIPEPHRFSRLEWETQGGE